MREERSKRERMREGVKKRGREEGRRVEKGESNIICRKSK